MTTNFHFFKIFPFVKKGVLYLCGMPKSFSAQVVFDKQPMLAVVIPQARKNGMHYEVNINGFPRFYMTWSALDRYDLAGEDIPDIPYGLVLAVSDVLEKLQSS